MKQAGYDVYADGYRSSATAYEGLVEGTIGDDALFCLSSHVRTVAVYDLGQTSHWPHGLHEGLAWD